MNDKKFLAKIAELWIELGGDADGVAWTWMDLQKEIESQLTDEQQETEQ